MKRDFYKTLVQWKGHPLRKPLIVRGARQVGKTFIVEMFGKNEFKKLFTINFEEKPEYHRCFETMDPHAIVRDIELISQEKLDPGETLLFLDEIQQCPKALQALRYFYEKFPEFHVIAAGSLLEFTIQEENFSFPVGRVQFAKLYPLSFGEFLDANGDQALRSELGSFSLKKPPSSAIHEHLLQKVRDYFVLGGMPSAIRAFLELQSFLEVKYAQQAIIKTYENDFGKYASKTKHRHLRKVFQEVPRLIGEHIKYSRIDHELPNPARDIKHALELLRLAGILFPIFATSAGGVPLIAGLKENVFKLLFLDIGLVENVLNIDPHYPGLMTGSLAEQFVGQEMLANGDSQLEVPLFFWARPNGSAEVDYLWTQGGKVYPIEVKAGKAGKLKSLQLFLDEKKASLGIKISQESLQLRNKILSIPFYLIGHLPRLIEESN